MKTRKKKMQKDVAIFIAVVIAIIVGCYFNISQYMAFKITIGVLIIVRIVIFFACGEAKQMNQIMNRNK